jgi:hypothetical protein
MFGWTRIFTLVAVAAVVAVVTGGAGATSTSTPAPGTVSHATTAGKASTAARRGALLRTANLNTLAGAARYLRAIGVDPRGLVIQRGARNYAGSSCPGAGWACTSTAHPVIQIAAAGGKNTFLCSTGSCAVVQTTAALAAKTPTSVAAAAAPPNKATCIKTSGLGQSCSISQTGGGTAIVYENSGKTFGLTQTASQTASITQRATGTNANIACVTQAVNIDGSTNLSGKKVAPINVGLEAHQTLTISQTSDANGSNTAVNGATASGTCDLNSTSPTYVLNQAQTLSSTVTGTGSMTQNENAANSGPNMTLDITQNQNAGTGTFGPNTATFNQTNSLSAIANGPGTVSLPISQTQSSLDGGILAAVNQSGPGVSTATATQNETQCEDAATSGLLTCSTTEHSNPGLASLAQTQHGPVRKTPGDSSQTGNTSDTFTVTQNSRQDSDSGSTQSNVVSGGFSTSGSGTVTQTTTVNGHVTPNSSSGQNVDTTTSCTGSACTSPTVTEPTIIFDGSPGTAAPPSTLGPYTMTAFGSDSQPTCASPGSTVAGVTDPAGTIGFTPALKHDTVVVPDVSGCWATWSHGYTGDVYDTTAAVDPTQATITLPSGTNAFYFYAEPNIFDLFNVTATAQDGTTSGPIQVQGNSGAQYFGFYGIGGATLVSITVTTQAEANGFAVGEFGINH